MDPANAGDWSRALARCELCPRRCGANRAAGAAGYCRAGREAQVFRYGPHAGEEPPISGSRGSGAVFFSRCTLRCLYCQNYPWSQEGRGDTLSVEALADVFVRLREAGCHNWNLVSPTPWLPMIVPALALARGTGRLPVVYNTSGYERLETVRALDGWVDLWLADLRYARAATAARASGAADYVACARAALVEMARQAGPLAVDGEGVAVRGVICRVLILPGAAEEAVASLEWLADALGTEAAVSVLAQYTPAYRARGRARWGRGITRAEYDVVWRAVERLGLGAGWVQEYEEQHDNCLAGFRMPAGGMP